MEDSLIKRISLAWHIKKLRDELGIGMMNWVLGCTDLRRKTKNRNPFMRKYTVMGGLGVPLL